MKIERDPETLKRWNYQEEAIVFWDNQRLTATPISRVSGYSIRKMLDEWRKRPT